MSEKELDGLLERQCELEKKVAEMISNTVKITQNSVVKLYLNRLVLDSLKHADMIQAIMDLRKGTVVRIAQKDKMREALEQHVAREKEMLTRLDEIILLVHEPKIKVLLQHMADDEKKHHKILEEVERIFGWRDATQEDWWSTVDRKEWLF